LRILNAIYCENNTGNTMPDVLVILAPGAEEIETITVADVLVRAKQNVTVASAVDDLVVPGSRGIPLAAHERLEKVRQKRFDLIYLPGGMGSATFARDNQVVQETLERQLADQRLLAVICAAPIALVPRSLARGRTLTSYPGVRAQVEPHAGRWLDQAVVTDGNLITSQGPGTAMTLALTLAKLLAGPEIAENVAKDMLIAKG
jgi:DJ-1 family protein